ncbi:MAG: COX15/CtaA family protein [Marmoricola sp.]
MKLEDFGDRWMRSAAWASLTANIAIVVTGAAVRLTGSGLGCPTWPRCTSSSFTPHGAMDVHQWVEFGNRTLTFVLAAIAIFTFVAALGYSRHHGRPDVYKLSILLGLAIPMQAVIGGITVLTNLGPWLVGAHMLASMVIISLAVVLIFRLQHGPTLVHNGAITTLAKLTYAVTWVVLAIGTVVTGAGPHAGDSDAPRNGLDTLEMSQLHADVVFLLIGLTVALLIMSTGLVREATIALVAVEVAQGALGFVQYFTDLPVVLVGFHMLGSALTMAAASWVLVASRAAKRGEVSPGTR